MIIKSLDFKICHGICSKIVIIIKKNIKGVFMNRFVEFDLSKFNIDTVFDNLLSNWHDSYWHTTDDGYAIDYILPGYKKSDISIKRKDDLLLLNITKKDKVKTYKLLLPDKPIDTITSKLEDGILTINCIVSKNSRYDYDIKIE